MNSQWKAVLGILLVFVFGCASGWLLRSVVAYRQTTQLLQRGPEGMVDVLERRLTRRLALDANQKQQVHAYLMQNVLQRRQLQMQIQPQVLQLNRQTLMQIGSVLRPDQQEKLKDELVLFRKRFGRGPFSPGVNDDAAPLVNPAPAPGAPPH